MDSLVTALSDSYLGEANVLQNIEFHLSK